MSTTLPPLSPREASSAPPPRPPRGWPGRRSLAVLMTGAALLGGGVTTGILAATGNLDGGASATTTVVRTQPIAATSSPGAAAQIDAGAIYAAASPGVVNITASGVQSSTPGPFGGTTEGTATGSGFVADEQGHIVTAAHVVAGASGVTVTLSDGTTRTATVTGTDQATDIAVLKIDPSGLTLHPLALGSSAELQVGDAVAAIGSPFGYAGSISTGIVSGVDRTIEAPNGFTVSHAIQTDAALNPGNSGGPILDASGKVIGVADQIATGGSDQSSGVGFAVPIDVVAAELSALEAGQSVKHAYLGVSTSDAPSGGALVADVTGAGPAADAGLRAGDVVTAIDGARVEGSSDLVAAVADHAPGGAIRLTVRRGSQTVTVTATLGTQPASRTTNP